jgi:hypothetical protein
VHEPLALDLYLSAGLHDVLPLFGQDVGGGRRAVDAPRLAVAFHAAGSVDLTHTRLTGREKRGKKRGEIREETQRERERERERE